MAEHTPGPWIYAPDHASYPNAPYMVWTSKGPGFGAVAETNSPGLQATDPGRQAADARLISAAPSLLAACEALVAVFDHPMSMLSDSLIRSETDAMRAAIAAAKGGA